MLSDPRCCVFLATACAAGIASSAAQEPPQPPPAVVAPAPAAYVQELARRFTSADGLPSDDVRALAVTTSGAVFAGTAAGLAEWRGGRWVAAAGSGPGAVDALAARGDEVLAAADGVLWSLRAGEWRRLAQLPHAAAAGRAIRLSAGREVLLAAADGIHARRAGRFERDTAFASLPRSGDARDVAQDGAGVVAVAAAGGLFVRRGGVWEEVHPAEGARSWAPRDVRAVAFDAQGSLWFASPQGTGRLGTDGWRLFTGAEGLPYADFTVLAAGDGGMWMGTRRGAIRFAGGVWEYRQGRRWLPDDDVRAIVPAPDGGAWMATAAGAGRIERRAMTLAEKARHFEDEIDARHRRTEHGFVLEVSLPRPGDLSEWRQHDSDNDGLWTAMYGAGECLAYAATRRPEAQRRARQAFEALRFLGEVTQGGKHSPPPGYVARTVLPTSGPDPNAGRLDRDRHEKANDDSEWKVIDPRWPVSADGKWYWKCDTSSDELDGHYFFYALYYDLAAETDAERARVRDVVRAITDHLIAHDYALVDHDGLPTRWARFGPRTVNGDPHWWEERGINSLSILSYLKVAEHVTGDAKYRGAARELIEKHSYAQNILYPKHQTGPGSGNQSDDEMAIMGFYSLLRYELDPELREVYAFAFRRYWELERPELNPLFNFLYAAVASGAVWADPWGRQDLSPQGSWLDESIDSLRRLPLDRADWSLTNSHRLDIVPVAGGRRGSRARGSRLDGTVLPIDERHVVHWNHDPWTLDMGGSGHAIADGAAFLLPYYLGLHHGFIAP